MNGYKVFTGLFDSVKDLVFLMEVEGDSFRYVYVNQAGINILNRPYDLIGKRIEEVDSPPLAKHLIEKYREVVETKQSIEVENTIETADGNRIGETSLNPILTEDGQCTYVLAIVRDITDRYLKEEELKQIKENLERQEKHLYSIIEHNDDLVFELDLQGKFKSINNKAVKVIGYKEEELVGQRFDPLIVEFDLDKAVNNFNQALSDKNMEYEIWVYHHTGKKILLHVKNIPIVVDGVLEGIYGIAKDITQEKAMENELERIKNELQLVWENTTDAIFIIAQDGSIASLNPTFEAMFGYLEEEIRDKQQIPIFPGGGEDLHHQSIVEKIRQGQEVLNAEVRRVTKSNEILEILASYRPINKGNILAVGMYKDITERKKFQKKLKESERRYRKLVELSPDAVIVYAKGKIRYINNAGVKLAGYASKKDVIGRSIWEFVTSKEREKIKQIANMRYENSNEEETEPITQEFVRSDGTVIDTEVSVAPVEYNGEEALQVILRDITERKEYEQQLQYLAYHDPLTGLKNRRSFTEILDQAIQHAQESQSKLAVMYMDMDNFKGINDSLGHEAGDELLKQFADRLRKTVRGSDILCRVGGDEFIVLLNHIADQHAVVEVAERLHEVLQQPYRLIEEPFQVTSSFGISLFPEHGTSAKRLLHHADIALYAAKQDRNKYQFYQTGEQF